MKKKIILIVTIMLIIVVTFIILFKTGIISITTKSSDESTVETKIENVGYKKDSCDNSTCVYSDSDSQTEYDNTISYTLNEEEMSNYLVTLYFSDFNTKKVTKKINESIASMIDYEFTTEYIDTQFTQLNTLLESNEYNYVTEDIEDGDSIINFTLTYADENLYMIKIYIK